MMKQPNRASKNLKSFGLSSAISAFAILSFTAPSFMNELFAAVVPAQKGTSLIKFKNWGLANTEDHSDIHAIDAWKIETGRKDILVAVIDTGIDANHPDLKSNIWDGHGNTASSRIPSSRLYGWDFTNDQPNPLDMHGHGTHVAGIIGAANNQKAGVSGVAQHVSIMGVKYYKEGTSGAVNLNNTVKAINYAIDHGARIINYSGGGAEFSEMEYLAIRRAEQKGILFVAAAGNERQNADIKENFYFPAAYGLSNIISVAATDIHNHLLPSSNWGKSKVDVAAPGENIYSTLPGGRYGYMTGTSQATAFVTGVAALLLSRDPSLKPAQIKELIRNSVDPIAGLTDKVGSGGRVNAYSALMLLKTGKRSSTPVLADVPSSSASAKVRNTAALQDPAMQPAFSPGFEE